MDAEESGERGDTNRVEEGGHTAGPVYEAMISRVSAASASSWHVSDVGVVMGRRIQTALQARRRFS